MMAEVLLDLVLSGTIELDGILHWMIDPSHGDLPPTDLELLKKRIEREREESSSSRDLKLGQAEFQDAVLGLIWEEAESLFQTLDLSSEAATPRTLDHGRSPGSTPQSRLSEFGGPQSPVNLNDANFPSLASAGLKQGKSEKVPPAALMRMVNLSRPQEISQTQNGHVHCVSSPKHRIAPTKVQVVERKQQFSAPVSSAASVAQAQPKQKVRIAPIKMEEPSKEQVQVQPRGVGSASQSSIQSAVPPPPPRNGNTPWETRPRMQAWASPNNSRSGPVDHPHARSECTHPAQPRQGSKGGGFPSPASSQGSTREVESFDNLNIRFQGKPLRRKEDHVDDDIDEKYGKTATISPKKGKKGKGRAQSNSLPKGHMLGKPPRSVSPANSSNSEVGSRQSSLRPGRNSTPQSRFRPSSVDGLQGTDQMSRPSLRASCDSKESLSFSHLQEDSTVDVGSPQTPTFAKLRAPGFQSTPANAPFSPANTIYFTASEAESPCDLGEQGDDTPSAQSINQPQSPNNHSSLNLRREQLSKALYGGKTGLTRPLNPLESELTLPPLAKELHDTDGPFQERKPDTEIASLSMNASSQLGFTQHEGTCESTVKSSHSSEEEIVNSIPVEQEVLLEKSLANDLQKLDLSEASLQNRLSTPLTSSPGWAWGTKIDLLAKLYAQVIKYSSTISIGREIELLVHLLMLPERVSTICKSPYGKEKIIASSEIAVQFSLHIFANTGNLLQALDIEMVECICGIATSTKASPEIVDTLQLSITSRRQKHQPVPKQVNEGTNAFSLLGFNSDGLARRTPEEQRRVSNRELCRDELLALLREVSNIRQALNSKPSSPHLAAEDAVFALVQHKAPALVRKVSPDNFGQFADLFLAAILQTAATGEILLDEELGKLAKQNLPKFRQLNQRLQAPSSGTQPSLLPASSAGSGRTSQGRARNLKSTNLRSRVLSGKGSPSNGHPSIAVASSCPPSLQVYIFILEAADSHRLNSSLERVLAARLQADIHDLAERKLGSNLAQHVTAMSTIALFLSYLQFAASGQTSASTDIVLPRDFAELLQSAKSNSQFIVSLFLVTQYLWFVPWATACLDSPRFREIKEKLVRFQHVESLKPGSTSFSLASLCVRSILESFWQRLGGVSLPENTVGGDEPEIQSMFIADVQFGDYMHSWLDSGLMRTFCPLLNQATLTLKAYVSGSKQNVRSIRQRKITPSVPVVPIVDQQIPEVVREAAAGVRDENIIKLQNVFLNMYSTAENKVKLRDVISLVSETVGHNVMACILDAYLVSLLSTELDVGHMSLEAQRLHTQKGSSVGAEILQGLLKSSEEDMIAKAVPLVLTGCLERAEILAKPNVIQAVNGLSHHTWTEAIRSTALAICLQLTKTLIAQQLLKEVPAKVRAFVSSKSMEAAKKVVKTWKENHLARDLKTDSLGKQSISAKSDTKPG